MIISTAPSDRGALSTSLGRFWALRPWAEVRRHRARETSVTARRAPLLFDEDALPGALFGSFGHRIRESRGHLSHTRRATRVGLHVRTLFDVGQSVVQQGEDLWTDLFTEPVARA